VHAVYENIVARYVNALKRRWCWFNLAHIPLSFSVCGFVPDSFGRNNPADYLAEYYEKNSSSNTKRFFTRASFQMVGGYDL
jgi:hypothetical protein